MKLLFAAWVLAIGVALSGAAEKKPLQAPATEPAASPFDGPEPAKPQSRIDKAVFPKLQKMGIRPARICSDPVFVRRVYLDVIGTLPTPAESQEFILSKDLEKRSKLIARLLEREEYADYWAMRWSDLLRVKAEFPINLWPNAAQAYHHWIRTAVKDNLPYDQFARELLTSNGSNFRVPPVNFYRAMQNREPEGIAQTVALNLMGTRAEKWPKARLEGMSVFFSRIGYKATSEWKEEIIFFDPAKTNAAGKQTDLKTAIFPDGKKARLNTSADPREAFTEWLLAPGNPWFARNAANRAWSWLLGRGIVHEPDDFRLENPPSNPELLAVLQRDLVSSHYNMKQLLSTILNSQVYQLSCVRRDTHSEGEAQFSHYPLRRLEAEVLVDALCQLTDTTEKYTSPIPEPFTYIPQDQRSIALPDGSITSPFLELFGRPPRDTGLESERNNRVTAAQRLHLLNSSHVQRKLEQSRYLQNLQQSKGTPKEAVTGLYLLVLSRFPTEKEWSTVAAYPDSKNVKSREALVDLAWALINSPEFLCRH